MSATADGIAQLTHQLYGAVYDDREWPVAAAAFKQLIPARTVGVGMLDPVSGEYQLLYGECDTAYGETCFLPEVENPMVASPVGQVSSEVTLMPRTEFERSTFFNSWLKPQGYWSFMAVKPVNRGRMSSFFGISRGRDEQAVTEAEVALMQSLTPLLTRVIHMRMDLGALRLKERTSTYDRLNIGVAVVDGGGRILHRNDLAERVLSEPDSGLSAQRGVLEAGRATAALRRLLADALAEPDGQAGLGGYMAVPRPDGLGRSLALTVAPVLDAGVYGLAAGKAAMIFIQSLHAATPAGYEPRLTALFGLTAKEAQVASALAQGYTLQQAAEQLQVSIHTARTHLARVLAKTGTGQQSQLVALLVRMMSPPY